MIISGDNMDNKEEINKYSENKSNNTRKSIEKDMIKTVIKLLIVTIIIAIIFCGVLFYINTNLGLIGLVFAFVFIAPILFKLFSVRKDQNIKYKDKEENE